MKNYVGIDLGTTNSAICSFDGEEVRLWKSPEQNDVTPSAIYIDRRGNKYVGKRAYDNAARSQGNAATLFKRFMGSSTAMTLPAVGVTLSPEECSAEVLRVLFGYLPEEMRNASATATVITVPAAFNQMQKDATMQAAEMARIGEVALMQEPVAAVMSVMRVRKSDGRFVVYDLGGGTLDIAIAECVNGRVSLLAHGGIEMCGGRDFDLLILGSVVKAWLLEHFDLPPDFLNQPRFGNLKAVSLWAIERAKIELSASESVTITLSEQEAQVRDQAGTEIYLDVPLGRTAFDGLIARKIADSIGAAQGTLAKAGLTANDVERIVFIGGPTQYKPLRDRVARELTIPGSADVNPMTAVAEGAALFAESIDWTTATHRRKSGRGTITAGGPIAVTINYIARTSGQSARVMLNVPGEAVPGAEFQIDSLDTGWSSGRLPLKQGASTDVPVTKMGENLFKLFVFDPAGGSIPLEQNRLGITRTAATVDAIPASHSIGIEVLERLGGTSVLAWMIRAGEPLPKHGKMVLKAGESLRAGSSGALNFKVWEGEIEDPVRDNRPIGVLKISGADVEDGVIAAGAELVCEYQIADSGNVLLEVSVPSVGAAFHSGHNFYSRQEGQIDYASASKRVIDEGQQTLTRLNTIAEKVDHPRLATAREKLESAVSIEPTGADPETTKQAMDDILEAKKQLAEVRKERLKEIRTVELEDLVQFFNDYVRQYATPAQAASFDNLMRTSQRAIERDENDFENQLGLMRKKNFEVMWRQDWFVIMRFETILESPHLYADRARFEELARLGREARQAGDIDRLRSIVGSFWQIQLGAPSEADMLDVVNIFRS